MQKSEQEENYITRANEILTILKDEHICSSDQEKDFNFKLGLARRSTLALAKRLGVKGPAITACVATTFLKVGLCQELAQRFVLEYCLNYQEKNISLIILANLNDPMTSHTLIQIGEVNAPDNIFIGRGNDVIVDVNTSLNFSKYLNMNNNIILADPLLNCAGISDEEIAPIWDYCKERKITDVIGVRTFSSVPNFVESASIVKKKALFIAEQIQSITNLYHDVTKHSFFAQETPNISNINNKNLALDEDGEPTIDFSFYTY